MSTTLNPIPTPVTPPIVQVVAHSGRLSAVRKRLSRNGSASAVRRTILD